MKADRHFGWTSTLVRGLLVPAVAGLVTALPAQAQQAGVAPEVSFTRDIAPILQRSCQNCHRPDGVGQGSGNRSIANMFIDLGKGVDLTETTRVNGQGRTSQ